jgi:hypothetical protein
MLKWVCFKVWILHELDCKTSEATCTVRSKMKKKKKSKFSVMLRTCFFQRYVTVCCTSIFFFFFVRSWIINIKFTWKIHTIHIRNDAVLLRESNYMHLKICAYNPLLTWYVMTTMGPSKDNSRLHALNMNGKTWTHCKWTCHCGMAYVRLQVASREVLQRGSGARSKLQNVRQDLGHGEYIKADWRKLLNEENHDLYFWDW